MAPLPLPYVPPNGVVTIQIGEAHDGGNRGNRGSETRVRCVPGASDRERAPRYAGPSFKFVSAPDGSSHSEQSRIADGVVADLARRGVLAVKVVPAWIPGGIDGTAASRAAGSYGAAVYVGSDAVLDANICMHMRRRDVPAIVIDSRRDSGLRGRIRKIVAGGCGSGGGR